MDILETSFKDAQEPEWLEKIIIGDLRTWQVMFISFAGVTSLIVMVCCCFRFRIPRTKQQIEADYQRRKITNKFRQQLETIQDAKMDAMSLHDALEFLHEKKSEMEGSNQSSQPESVSQPQQDNPEASTPQPATSGLNFSKLAGKVAALSKLGPKSPTTATPDAPNPDNNNV